MTSVVDKGNVRVVKFDNLTEMIEASERKAATGFRGSYSGSRISRDESPDYDGGRGRRRGSFPWAGTKTFEEATDLARKGWSEMRSEVESAFGPLANEIRDALPDVNLAFMNVAGAGVDVGSFLAGDPMCMIDFRTEQVSTAGKVVTIVANVSVNAHIDADRMVKRGVGIAALCYALALLDHSTEVWVQSGAKTYVRGDGTAEFACMTRVKDAANAEDIDNLMFALAHPGFFRRLYFSVYEVFATGKWQNWGGYGSATGVTQAEDVEATIVIDNQGTDIALLESHPAEWVRKQLRTLGLLED